VCLRILARCQAMQSVGQSGLVRVTGGRRLKDRRLREVARSVHEDRLKFGTDQQGEIKRAKFQSRMGAILQSCHRSHEPQSSDAGGDHSIFNRPVFECDIEWEIRTEEAGNFQGEGGWKVGGGRC